MQCNKGTETVHDVLLECVVFNHRRQEIFREPKLSPEKYDIYPTKDQQTQLTAFTMLERCASEVSKASTTSIKVQRAISFGT